jgi:hypothetical protein
MFCDGQCLESAAADDTPIFRIEGAKAQRRNYDDHEGKENIEEVRL